MITEMGEWGCWDKGILQTELDHVIVSLNFCFLVLFVFLLSCFEFVMCFCL